MRSENDTDLILIQPLGMVFDIPLFRDPKAVWKQVDKPDKPVKECPAFFESSIGKSHDLVIGKAMERSSRHMAITA